MSVQINVEVPTGTGPVKCSVLVRLSAIGADTEDAVTNTTAVNQFAPKLLAEIVSKTNQDLMRVFVRTPMGRTLAYNLPHTAQVLTLCQYIHAEIGLPVEVQRLIFAGRQLPHNGTLAEHGVKNDSTVHIILLLRGS